MGRESLAVLELESGVAESSAFPLSPELLRIPPSAGPRENWNFFRRHSDSFARQEKWRRPLGHPL